MINPFSLEILFEHLTKVTKNEICFKLCNSREINRLSNLTKLFKTHKKSFLTNIENDGKI